MQASARQVEQELDVVNETIANLKTQLRHLQESKIDKINRSISQFEFDTLGNESQIFKLKQKQQELLDEIKYLQQNFSSFQVETSDRANKENSSRKQQEHDCHICSSFIELFNFLNENSLKTRKESLTIQDLQQSF